jgi:PleD family two-component response regulator
MIGPWVVWPSARPLCLNDRVARPRAGERAAGSVSRLRTDNPSHRVRHMTQTKILIVDDDASTRLVLNARLKAKNYQTVFAGDSYQAVSAARKEQPNLVILDIG